MSQFSRRARWLNELFLQSKAPASRDPDSVSDDVSLVQQYDGGGWLIPDTPDWFHGPTLSSPAGAAGSTPLVTVPADKIFRLFAIHVFTLINGQADANPIVSQSAASGGVSIADQVNTPLAPLGGARTFLIGQAMILPPGTFLYGSHFNGTGTTVISWNVYGVLAPIGSVFNC